MSGDPDKGRPRAAAAFLLLLVRHAIAEEYVMKHIVDHLWHSEVAVGGSCANGCVRRYFWKDKAPGPPTTANCTVTPVQSTEPYFPAPDANAASSSSSFRLTHFCDDEVGGADCRYSVCADVSYDSMSEDISFDLVIVHDAPQTARVARNVTVTLVMEYTPLGFPNICPPTNFCDTIPQCPSGVAEVAVEMVDSYGDGWRGAYDGSGTNWR
ncbi:unnamed protein product, partial [Phaeothamnion confervicola]